MTTELSLDPKSQVLIKGNQAVRLRPTEFILLSVLLEHYPQPVPTTVLKEKLWGHRSDGGPEAKSSLGVITHNLRQSLKRFDLTVASDMRSWHAAYSIKEAA